MPRCRKGKIFENKIGRRYKKAGYKVQQRKRTRHGEVDVIAKRGKEKILIEAKHSSRKRIIPSSEVEKLAKKARKLKAKATFVLGGRATMSGAAKRLARSAGIKVRRV